MRHYRNTATRAEIFTENEIHGDNWVEIVVPTAKDEPPKEPPREPAKKAGRGTRK